uniref:Uncharacterized protein n=1 Tax=Arundo donax TaxID=35708 RepID=A0A0A9E470_ARUDO
MVPMMDFLNFEKRFSKSYAKRISLPSH